MQYVYMLFYWTMYSDFIIIVWYFDIAIYVSNIYPIYLGKKLAGAADPLFPDPVGLGLHPAQNA